ncbi:carbon storage regulator [Martelella alba]|uniref:Carbon storage regulator n=1 Tax=Martelella alba TaxID=2590451 RepID=A0A506UAS0_9HYPH|nr:carbon storage regulator [Martelella alba]TPW31463.1 carbon storage regulator [Martelella alba]
MALKIDLRIGETLQVGEARLKLVRKAGRVATLVIDAPREVIITSNDQNGAATEKL